MAKKNITIDKLAVMVQKGFSEQTERFDGLEKDIKAIRQQIAGAIFRSEFDGLASRVEYLENILDLPAKKH